MLGDQVPRMLIGACDLIVVPGSHIHRYFFCQPNHGTLVKPQKATACVDNAGGFGFDDGSESEADDSDV